ncbi:hypothetical protein BaRGS_00013206 [Batillaria attramentaria]|uniref:Uncharacterized protein n=1 Tax=Batillaria attramentaria TaxID=370345 RepID=A0ABD0L8L2_9CAEN
MKREAACDGQQEHSNSADLHIVNITVDVSRTSVGNSPHNSADASCGMCTLTYLEWPTQHIEPNLAPISCATFYVGAITGGRLSADVGVQYVCHVFTLHIHPHKSLEVGYTDQQWVRVIPLYPTSTSRHF